MKNQQQTRAGFLMPDLPGVLARAADAGLDGPARVARVFAEALVSMLGSDPAEAARDGRSVGRAVGDYPGCHECFAAGYAVGMNAGIALGLRAVEVRGDLAELARLRDGVAGAIDTLTRSADNVAASARGPNVRRGDRRTMLATADLLRAAVERLAVELGGPG